MKTGSWVFPTQLSGVFFMVSGLGMFLAPNQVVKILQLQPLGSEQAKMYLRLAGIALSIVGNHQIDAATDRLVKFAR